MANFSPTSFNITLFIYAVTFDNCATILINVLYCILLFAKYFRYKKEKPT